MWRRLARRRGDAVVALHLRPAVGWAAVRRARGHARCHYAVCFQVTTPSEVQIMTYAAYSHVLDSGVHVPRIALVAATGSSDRACN